MNASHFFSEKTKNTADKRDSKSAETVADANIKAQHVRILREIKNHSAYHSDCKNPMTVKSILDRRSGDFPSFFLFHQEKEENFSVAIKVEEGFCKVLKWQMNADEKLQFVLFRLNVDGSESSLELVKVQSETLGDLLIYLDSNYVPLKKRVFEDIEKHSTYYPYSIDVVGMKKNFMDSDLFTYFLCAGIKGHFVDFAVAIKRGSDCNLSLIGIKVLDDGKLEYVVSKHETEFNWECHLDARKQCSEYVADHNDSIQSFLQQLGKDFIPLVDDERIKRKSGVVEAVKNADGKSEEAPMLNRMRAGIKN